MNLTLTDQEKSLIIRLVLLIAVMYGLVYGAENRSLAYTADVRQLNTQLNEEMTDYRARLSEINEEEQEVSRYVESYNQYLEEKLILGPEQVENLEVASRVNEEQRLFLLERLQDVKNDRRFFDINYELSRPTNLPSTFSALTADSDVAVRANVMRVRMPLLHSLDMLMLLNDFYDAEDNKFTPVHCDLTYVGKPRTGAGSDQNIFGVEQNINSSCDLVWLSVYDPKQGQGRQET
jgi:hypothetical protein